MCVFLTGFILQLFTFKTHFLSYVAVAVGPLTASVQCVIWVFFNLNKGAMHAAKAQQLFIFLKEIQYMNEYTSIYGLEECFALSFLRINSLPC
jgi:hypothetical protein